GDQVHAIAQRRKQRHIASLVVGNQVFRFELGVQVANRDPSVRRESADYAADLFVYLAFEFGIVTKLGARRNRDQNHRHVAMRTRIPLQEALEALDSLQDALGVVEAIDAEHDSMVLVAHCAPNAHRAVANPRFGRQLFEVLNRNAQWEGADLDGTPAEVDFVAFAVDLCAENFFARALEMIYVGPRMKADQIAAEHSGQQLAPPGEDPEHLLRREGDVPEQPDRQLRTPRPNHHRRDREMEILDPH